MTVYQQIDGNPKEDAMLDLSPLVVSQRLMAEQFSEKQVAPRPSRGNSAQKPLRTAAARSLRTIADALEPTPERRTAR